MIKFSERRVTGKQVLPQLIITIPNVMNLTFSQPFIDFICEEMCKMDNVYMKGSKIRVEVNIAGKPLHFRIDTGADVSLVKEQSWNCFGQPKLATATEQLRNASGAIMSFMGTFKHCVHFRNTETFIQFFVKKDGGKNLLGMDWLKKIGLAQACNTYLSNLGNQISQGICHMEFPYQSADYINLTVSGCIL